MSGIGAISRLDPGACDFSQKVDGGWVAEITASDLAGILGHMTDDQANLVRVIVLNDAKAMRQVIAKVRGMLLSSALTLQEQVKLAPVIVYSVVMPSLCRTCDGHGQHLIDALTVSCPNCAGTGKRTVIPSDLCDNAGIKDYRRHSDDFSRCRSTLIGWLKDAGKIWRDEMS